MLSSKDQLKYMMGLVRLPVCLPWLVKASGLSGKSLHLALALSQAGVMQQRSVITLDRAVMARFHLSRDACYDGLRRLEAAKLIRVERQAGCRPLVTLLDLRGRMLTMT